MHNSSIDNAIPRNFSGILRSILEIEHEYNSPDKNKLLFMNKHTI